MQKTEKEVPEHVKKAAEVLIGTMVDVEIFKMFMKELHAIVGGKKNA